MYRAYDDDSLPIAARAGIGHIRKDFCDRVYGIVLDNEAAEFQTAYMAEGEIQGDREPSAQDDSASRNAPK